MRPASEAQTVGAIRLAARRLTDDGGSDALMELIGDAHVVLLGEASHGSHEFYAERARITQRLIVEKGFHAVAVEGDWPDAYRVNRFVRGLGDAASAESALSGFQRFPSWMWRNTVVVEFITWLRTVNDRRPEAARCGFYGLDLYSMHASMDAVLRYLDQEHPDLAALTRERYACFDRFGDDSQVYGLMTGLRGVEACRDGVMATLVDLRRRAAQTTARRDTASGHDSAEDRFDAEQNARLVKNAEAYYRSMYLSDVSSWNQRDQHMAETLEALQRHLARHTEPPKLVVWAHNSHLGDARATEMGQQRGELNVGQLVRERHGQDAVLVGFTTHGGSVTAASDWGGRAQRMQIVRSRPDSIEGLMHAAGIARFVLPLRPGGRHVDALRDARLERAIGVIYRPETERQSHYFFAQLPQQFDALVHIDTTRALEPLERDARGGDAEAPETYPSGV